MRSVRAAALVNRWNRLSPLARLAAWRRLPPGDARAAFDALPAPGRWLLYLGCDDGALAPLREKGETDFRRIGAAERAAYRKALA